jgi:hypothetical protein
MQINLHSVDHLKHNVNPQKLVDILHIVVQVLVPS